MEVWIGSLSQDVPQTNEFLLPFPTAFLVDLLHHTLIPRDLPFDGLKLVDRRNSVLIQLVPGQEKMLVILCHFLQDGRHSVHINLQWAPIIAIFFIQKDLGK